MNCYQHPDSPATAFCRDCGRALCATCQRLENGTIFCSEHAPMSTASTTAPPFPPSSLQGSNPYQQAGTLNRHVSPGLAFFLGFIPGVGAIYNGQYAKGLVHAGIVGLLISLLNATEGDSGQVFLALMLVAFWGYMVFEAYHTAKARRAGLPVDEFSSLIATNRWNTRAPLGPIVLIGLGVLFLLDTLHLFAFRELARFWPILLIVAGGFMLYNRVGGLHGGQHELPPSSIESSHEQ